MADEPLIDAVGDADDPQLRRLDGPTPAGGAYAIVSYLDESGAPAPRSKASQARIEEFAADGELLASTIGSI